MRKRTCRRPLRMATCLTTEVHLSVPCVLVLRRHHLRKVNDDRLPVVRHHNVKLVEIAVNDAVVGKLKHEVHELVVEVGGVLDLGNVLGRDSPMFKNYS
jgi:hypothetical protein